MKFILKFFLIFISFLAILANAQSDNKQDYYTIELILFAQDELSAINNYLNNIKPIKQPQPLVEDAINLIDPLTIEDNYVNKLNTQINNNTTTVENITNDMTHNNSLFFSMLDETELTLAPEVMRLDQHYSTRVITHLAWHQPSYPFNNPQLVRIKGGQEYQKLFINNQNTLAINTWQQPIADLNTEYEIDGTVAFSKGTYLHLNIDLMFKQEIPRQYIFGLSDNTQSSGSKHYINHYIKLRRRLRVNELNYFDNEHFGAIAVIRNFYPYDNEN